MRAAESQATTAEEGLDLARTARYEADRPYFDFEILPAADGYASGLVVTRTRSGPTTVELSAEWQTGWGRLDAAGVMERHHRPGGGTFRSRDLVRNQATNLGVFIPPEAAYIYVDDPRREVDPVPAQGA